MITHSIRMKEEVYAILKREATSKSVSMSNLVSQILEKYAEFDRFVEKFQFIFFHKNLVLRGLQAFSEKEARGVGNPVGAAFAKDAFLMMGLPFNKESMKYFIETIVAGYKNFCTCEKHSVGNKELFYLRHDLGPKWSAFLSGYVSGAFKNILGEEIVAETHGDGVSFTM